MAIVAAFPVFRPSLVIARRPNGPTRLGGSHRQPNFVPKFGALVTAIRNSRSIPRPPQDGFQRKGHSPSFGRFRGDWGGGIETPPEFFFGGLGVYSFNSERIHPRCRQASLAAPPGGASYLGHGLRRPNSILEFGASLRDAVPCGIAHRARPTRFSKTPYSFSPVRPSRTRRSAIMAMNSELVGLPLVLETV